MMGLQLRVEKRMLPHVPWGLVVGCVAIALIGIFNLASATRAHDPTLWRNQAVYLCAALAAGLGVALVDYRFVQRMVVPIYALTLVSLIALRFVGHTAKGAESWFVLGPIRVQPAEFMKIGLVLMLAKFFHEDFRPQEPSYGFGRLLIPAALSIVPIALVLLQPDLGTAMMMALSSFSLVLFARVRWWVVAVIGVAALGAAVVLWNDYLRDQPEHRATIVRGHLKKHQDVRITGWLDPEADPKGINYHSIQSKIAIGSGGLTGRGWMKGTQTENFFLPEQHTDFVFSVFAEEHGFLACLVLLVLYGFVLISALGVAFNARDRFGAMLAVGVALMIFWQVFQNIGMVTGLLPVTGITLPLMSYGGSSMVSVMIGIGLLVSVGMRRHVF